MKLIVQDMITDVLTQELAAYADKNVALVALETPVRGGNLSRLEGLDEALRLASEYTPVVALSVMGNHGHRLNADDPRWHAMLGYTHVAYRDGICTIEDIRGYLDEVLQLPIGVRDPLALRLLGTGTLDDAFARLCHDLPHARNRGEEGLMAWEARAKPVLGDLGRERLMKIVENRDPSLLPAGPFAGESFPDVCVDVEGTLFDSDGNLRQEVLERVHAEAVNRPVTIWTGGDTRGELVKKIRGAGLIWKLASKYQLKGAAVAVAIDDLPQADFEISFGITVEQYVQV